MWNANERKGKIDETKGRVKQAVGTLTGDEALKAEGERDETVGKVEGAVGRTTKKVDDLVATVAEAVKK